MKLAFRADASETRQPLLVAADGDGVNWQMTYGPRRDRSDDAGPDSD